MFTTVQSKKGNKKMSKKTTTTKVETPVPVPIAAVQSNGFNCLDTESDTEDSVEDSVKTVSRKPGRVLVHRKKLWSEWESDDEDD
jgi:hypothetical protein